MTKGIEIKKNYDSLKFCFLIFNFKHRFKVLVKRNSKETMKSQKNYPKTAFDKTVRRNDKIILILLKITIIFGISWLPWNLFNISTEILQQLGFNSNDLNMILSVCHLIAMSSAISNAIFYGFLHKIIQKEIRRIITGVRRGMDSGVFENQSDFEI